MMYGCIKIQESMTMFAFERAILGYILLTYPYITTFKAGAGELSLSGIHEGFMGFHTFRIFHTSNAIGEMNFQLPVLG